MTIPEMLGQSGLLTVLGMGVVFSFLIILIGVMKLLELFVRAMGLDKEETSASPAAAPAASNGQNQAIVAAISAAINEKQK